jgi:deoxyadenosine/deoxycytidine kinase
MFLSVAGIISSGKTTFTEILAKKINFIPLFEPVKTNKYLDDFYDFLNNYSKIQKFLDDNINNINDLGLKRWMFECQIPYVMQGHLLGKRYILHQKALWGNYIQDRNIYEDSIFAKMLYDDGKITKRDFETYQEIFQAMKHTLMYPDVIIFLDVDPETALNRMKQRGRECEKNVSIDYLKALNKEYQQFIIDINQWCKVLKYDWNENLYTNSEEYNKIIDNIINDIKIVNETRSNFFRSITKI